MSTRQNRLLDNVPHRTAITSSTTESTVVATANHIDTTTQLTELDPFPTTRCITQWGCDNQAAAATPDQKIPELPKSMPAPRSMQTSFDEAFNAKQQQIQQLHLQLETQMQNFLAFIQHCPNH